MRGREPSVERRIVELVLLGCGLLGCTVEVPAVIDDGLFACRTPDDCGEGQGCAEGNVYSPDFCTPACDLDDPESCPEGVCTAAGACLTRCMIRDDGTSTGCTSPDFVCVRTDAIRDEGVCYPVEPCSRTADCSRDGSVPQLCLNEALGLPATTIDENLRFDNLYCTAAPDTDGRCPTGYLSFRFADPDGSVREVCYAPCALDGDGPYCPPGTTCFRGFGELVGTPDTPPCLPGVWGLPCLDDTQCLIGRCLEVGDGMRACTETCEDALALAGGCEGLAFFSESSGAATRLTCEMVGDNEVCVPRFDLLELCDDQLECVGSGTVCTPVRFGNGVDASVCLRFCREPRDCALAAGGSPEDYRCLSSATGDGLCLRKKATGGRCTDDADCLEGFCCDVGGFSACLATCE